MEKMNLPEDFSFSQSMIQNYLDCEYRFLLLNIRKVEWPAVEFEPVLLNQEKMRLGQLFHRIVQQYFAGIEPEVLRESILEPKVMSWWDNFLELNLLEQEGEKNAEQFLSIPFAGYRLSAKLDLVLRNPSGEITIYDWKTSLIVPNATILRARAQSRVYPLIQYQLNSSTDGNNGVTSPSVRMVYWFPEFPRDTIVINYEHSLYQEDESFVRGLIAEIANKTEEEFATTPDSRKCAYCRYRSLCSRGIVAGDITSREPMIFEEDIFGPSSD